MTIEAYNKGLSINDVMYKANNKELLWLRYFWTDPETNITTYTKRRIKYNGTNLYLLDYRSRRNGESNHSLTQESVHIVPGNFSTLYNRIHNDCMDLPDYAYHNIKGEYWTGPGINNYETPYKQVYNCASFRGELPSEETLRQVWEKGYFWDDLKKYPDNQVSVTIFDGYSFSPVNEFWNAYNSGVEDWTVK